MRMISLLLGSLVALGIGAGVAAAGAEPNRHIAVVGTLTDEGFECQALRARNGKLYTLTGNLSGVQSGDRVRVRGRVAEVSFCMQGVTIEVTGVKELR